MSDNQPLDIAEIFVSTASRIHAALNREMPRHEETDLREFLAKVPNSRERWKRDKRTREEYYVASREDLLAMAGVTETDLKQVPKELRKEFENVISSVCKQDEEEFTRRQYKISLLPEEKREIERVANRQGYKWSDFAARAALNVSWFCESHENIGLELQDLVVLAAVGLYLIEAFTPDELDKAITATGLDYATGKKLMAELERLRDARMKSDLMAGGSQQAHP